MGASVPPILSTKTTVWATECRFMAVVPWIKLFRQNLPQTQVFAVSRSWQRWEGIIWGPYGILLGKKVKKNFLNILLDSNLHILGYELLNTEL